MDKIYDAIIVGGGPAGLSAAIYMARAQFRVLVVEKESWGGQITMTSEVVNYPGILGTDGEKLTAVMAKQAIRFGADFLSATVTGMELDGDYKTVHTDRGDYRALGMVYAAGAHPRRAGFVGEDQFRGRGVAYCATCDGEFFTGKDIFVVGGGYSAIEEGLFLTRYGKKVSLVVREEALTVQSAAVEEVKVHPKIEILYHTEIEKIDGDGTIREITFRNRKTGETFRYVADDGDFCGVFVFVGYRPATELVRGKIDLDENGYILTDRNQKTNVDGVYAAGDICVKELRQVVTAVSDGAVAATSLEKYLGEQYRKLRLKREIPQDRKEELQAEKEEEEGCCFLDTSLKQALTPVLARFERPVLLRLYTDDTRMTAENKAMLKELAGLSDKIRYECIPTPDEASTHTISICDEKGHEKGMRFHGVPGGHEFNSFVLGMYNVAGPGQRVGEEAQRRIESVSEERSIRILVSLSCTMCPDLVAAAQRIAAGNEHVTAEVFDLQHYPELKERYHVMSVPCMILDDESIHFGKKNVTDILDLLGV